MDSGLYWIVVPIVVLVALLIILTIYFAVRDKQEKNFSGREAIVGETGVAKTDLDPEGRILVHGEWWNARADENIPEGAKVKVVKAESMMLRVTRAPEED